MSQHFFDGSGDLPHATGGYLDDDSGWWVGVQSAATNLILAAAIAVASQGAIAQAAAVQQQDDPSLTAGYIDEQTWQNPSIPFVAPNVLPDHNNFDEQVPALTAGYLDEQTYQQPVTPVFYIPQQPPWDDQFIVPPPTALIPDDNEVFFNPVPPYVAPNVVLPPIDEQTPLLFGVPDDNEIYHNQVAPYVAPNVVPLAWLLDDQTPTTVGLPRQIILLN
jgi:hypothetical protein